MRCGCEERWIVSGRTVGPVGVGGAELTTEGLLDWREYAISRDGGSKASYEQRSNETHLGVGETDLETVNTFASVKGGDEGLDLTPPVTK